MAVGGHGVGVVIEMVVERVLALGGGVHPVRVGVDGRSAAGKTTFAEALAARVRERSGRPVIRAELDHFMRMVSDRDAYPYDGPEGYYRDSRDWPAVRRLLLEPLGPGGDRWYQDALTTPDGAAAPRRRAEEDAILIADGIFLQRPELDEHWDLRIYLEVGPAESLRRAVERDRRWMGSAAEAEARHRRLYLPGEQRYLAEVGPRERAQVVIDNRDPGRPMIIRS